MKYKILTTLLLIPFFASSQINSSIDLILGIDYDYRTLKTSSKEVVIDSIMNIRSGETAKINWRFGINYNKRLNEHLVFKTGLRLASVGYNTTKRTGIRWPSEFGNGGYMPDPNLYHEFQSSFNYWYIELPLIARYEFNVKKISPFFEIGIAPSYYLNTRITQVTDIENNSNITN